MDKLTLTVVALLVLEDGALKSAGEALVLVDVVGELSWHLSFDLLDASIDLGEITSPAAVFELHGVGS